MPVWWDWGVVRAGGVGTRGISKRGRVEDKGKEAGSDLKCKIKGVAIAKSPFLAGLKTASRAVVCAPLSPHGHDFFVLDFNKPNFEIKPLRTTEKQWLPGLCDRWAQREGYARLRANI